MIIKILHTFHGTTLLAVLVPDFLLPDTLLMPSVEMSHLNHHSISSDWLRLKCVMFPDTFTWNRVIEERMDCQCISQRWEWL